MDPWVRDVLNGLRFKGDPAAADSLEKLQQFLDVPLPEEYRELLQKMDGCEGPIGEENYVMIYSAADAIVRNDGDVIQQEYPGLVVFASDGGDYAYCFDVQADELAVVETSFAVPSDFPPKVVGRSLCEWLKYLEAS